MTSQERKVIELALEALGAYMSATDSEEDAKAHNLMAEAFFKIKEALAQPEQEPVAWKETDEVECPVCKDKGFPWPKCGHITYLEPAPPPQRTWVGLSEKEMYKLWLTVDEETDRMAFGKAVEAKLKEKNTTP